MITLDIKDNIVIIIKIVKINNFFKNLKMELQIIIGPMFSGKTTELMRRIRR